MAKQDKISMPSSVGGIVRYMDESTSKVSIQPMIVIYLIAAVVIVFGILIPLFV
jgi:preprotein translocase subunit Sec61beta